jgi:hypothetical protein
MPSKKFIKPFKKDSADYQVMLRSFNFDLIVNKDFDNYRVGQRVSNPTAVQKILKSHHFHDVVQVKKI